MKVPLPTCFEISFININEIIRFLIFLKKENPFISKYQNQFQNKSSFGTSIVYSISEKSISYEYILQLDQDFVDCFWQKMLQSVYLTFIPSSQKSFLLVSSPSFHSLWAQPSRVKTVKCTVMPY